MKPEKRTRAAKRDPEAAESAMGVAMERSTPRTRQEGPDTKNEEEKPALGQTRAALPTDELKGEVQSALDELEAGKSVAVYKRLERLLARLNQLG